MKEIALVFLVGLAACSGHDRGPRFGPHLDHELAVSVSLESPAYPFQPIAVTITAAGRPITGHLKLDGPGGTYWGAYIVSEEQPVLLPQVPGLWQAVAWIGGPEHTPTSDPVTFEVVGHVVELASVDGFPGLTPYVLRSEAGEFVLLVFDEDGKELVSFSSQDNGEVVLPPDALEPGVYYVQAITPDAGSTRLQPLWVTRPGTCSFNADFGRGGFTLRRNAPKLLPLCPPDHLGGFLEMRFIDPYGLIHPMRVRIAANQKTLEWPRGFVATEDQIWEARVVLSLRCGQPLQMPWLKIVVRAD